MTATVQELVRLLALAALLLSFAILAARRSQRLGHAAQCAAIVMVALGQAWLQASWADAAIAAVLAVQAAALWLRRRPMPVTATAFPVATVCAALLLVALATASAPSEGMAVPLAIVLLGLLGTAAMPGPYGLLSLLNGVVLAMLTVPGLPLRPVTALALAGLAWLVAGEGVPLRWARR